jgi:hypothetical protein
MAVSFAGSAGVPLGVRVDRVGTAPYVEDGVSVSSTLPAPFVAVAVSAPARRQASARDTAFLG